MSSLTRCFARPLESPFGKQDLRTQRLEAVAPGEPVHHPDQVVQALRVGVRDRMFEVRQDLWHPVLERLGQRLEVPVQAVRNRSVPLAKGVVRVVCRRTVVDPVKGSLAK